MARPRSSWKPLTLRTSPACQPLRISRKWRKSMPRQKGKEQPRQQSKTGFKGPRKPQAESKTKFKSQYKTEQPESPKGKTSRPQQRTATGTAGKRPTLKKWAPEGEKRGPRTEKPTEERRERRRETPSNRTLKNETEKATRTLRPRTERPVKSQEKRGQRTERPKLEKWTPKTERPSKSLEKRAPRTERPTEERQERRPKTETPKERILRKIEEKAKTQTPRPRARSKQKPVGPSLDKLERIQKIIAAGGVTSRRKAEELMTQGRVTVNGQTVTELGAKANPFSDRIEVDGRKITAGGEPEADNLLNKPEGDKSSVSDEHNRPVVTDLVKVKVRVYPVGRLDYDAEGVILLTTDGDLSNRLIHPTFMVAKIYQVKVKGAPTREKLQKLEKGVYLDDGRTLPATAKFLRATDENSWIELTVFEGRNHLVKRMCMAIGHPVQKLKRVEFAGIRLGILKPGEWRPLTQKELDALQHLSKGK